MRKFFLLAAALVLLPGVIFAYAKPGNPTGFVNDFAGMLTAEQKQQLEAKLVGYEKSSGNEIAVVMVATLGGDTVENFAAQLFEDWKIGKEGEDNGILLLIAREDRKMRIEVGYGLEPQLTDIEASHLLANVLVPAFKNGSYFAGIDQATDLMMQKLGGESSEAFAQPPESGPPPNYFLIGIFALLFLSRVFAQTRSWWLGGAIGAAAGLVVTLIYGFILPGLIAFLLLIPLGLIVDFIFSRIGPGGGTGGVGGLGGWGSSGGSGGSFGGFGGGSSGGGGASGRW